MLHDFMYTMSKKYIPPHRRSSREDDEVHDLSFSTPSRNGGNNNHLYYDEESHQVLSQAIPKAYCINLASRTDKWDDFQRFASNVSPDFLERIERFNAVDGSEYQVCDDIQIEWDATTNAKYSPKEEPGIRTMLIGEIGCALSHIALWRRLAASDDTHALILEDDCGFVSGRRGRDRFATAFARAWRELPQDWAIFYLGFSSRGERQYVKKYPLEATPTIQRDNFDVEVDIYSPEYGYHTHAYMITKAGAQCLLENLPVCGPIDVWLADHGWFGLPTYCAVIANEGWRLDDGTYEGRHLVHQVRGKNFASDVSPRR